MHILSKYTSFILVLYFSLGHSGGMNRIMSVLFFSMM